MGCGALWSCVRPARDSKVIEFGMKSPSGWSCDYPIVGGKATIFPCLPCLTTANVFGPKRLPFPVRSRSWGWRMNTPRSWAHLLAPSIKRRCGLPVDCYYSQLIRLIAKTRPPSLLRPEGPP